MTPIRVGRASSVTPGVSPRQNPGVLFKRRVLDGIADGSVDLAFRRWERPRVREGTRLRTAVGVIEIVSVEVVAARAISAADAARAGYETRAGVLRELDRRPSRRIYRIGLRLAGPDHRVALRERAKLGASELRELRARLDEMDKRSRHGPWTRQTLELIREKPATLAAELAAELGREKRPFKADVRRLKELGLTESLERGYRLSPRGRAFIEQDLRT
jgi:hypothetical protein